MMQSVSVSGPHMYAHSRAMSATTGPSHRGSSGGHAVSRRANVTQGA